MLASARVADPNRQPYGAAYAPLNCVAETLKDNNMSAEDNEELNTQETEPTEEVVKTDVTEETAAEVETEGQEESSTPEYTDYEKKMFKNWKKAEEQVRTLKLENENLKKGSAPVAQPAEKQAELTAFDTIALIDAKVTHRDDIELVKEYAKFKGISIGDALNSSVMKAELSQQAETRRTADVTNTGGSKRTVSKVSDEVLLANARQGKYPDDPEALAEARFRAKYGSK